MKKRAGMLLSLAAIGCAAIRSPLPDGLGITAPPAVPVLPEPPPAVAAPKPEARKPVADPSKTPLELAEVLTALERNFPLIDAAEQERSIALGLRQAAEGAFDTQSRLRGGTRDGTFDNSNLDATLEQPLAFHGMNVFAGYRFGLGSYPVYSGGLKTAAGGEFRAGFLLPLLRDGPIDRRRVILRQAQIGVALAEPTVLRVRIDAYRAARRAYFNWLAAGEQVVIAERFTAVAKERESVVRDRFQRGAANELDAAQAKQTLAEREGRLAVANQRFQQASIDLSLLYRDGTGAPLLAGTPRLPRDITAIQPKPVNENDLPNDVVTALGLRPELVRFQLQKERVALELRLAQNQMAPGLNLGAFAAQDVGPSSSKPPNTGIFALDRTAAEAFLTFDLPVQRRDARGRMIAAQATLNQIVQQERFARDAVTAEVQSVYSVLLRDLERLTKAREEQESANRVVAIAREQFERGLITLFVLNSLEVIDLDAQAKVVEVLADYYRAQADYLAALGLTATE